MGARSPCRSAGAGRQRIAVINAALPSIGDEYNVDGSTLQWTMTAYAIAFAGFLLFGGRVADVLGRRKIFAVGIALFAVASLGAALAPTVGVLIAARALQGIGASLSGPASLALLSQIFPEGPQRNRALGVYAATGGSSVLDEHVAQLSPLKHANLNVLGRWPAAAGGTASALRSLSTAACAHRATRLPPNGRVTCRWAGAFLVGRCRPRFSSAGCRPLVGAALVYGGVDAVAQQVGVMVGEGPVQVPQDYFEEHVLLVRAGSEPLQRLRRQFRARRLREDLDRLHAVSVWAQGVADPVSEIFRQVVAVYRDGQVPADGRHGGDGPVGGQARQLGGHGRFGRAQDADVRDALEQHQHPVESHAEREAAPRAVEAGSLQHLRVRQTAFRHLNPLAVACDVHLAAGEGVGVDAILVTVLRPGEEPFDEDRDHFAQVGGGHGGRAAG